MATLATGGQLAGSQPAGGSAPPRSPISPRHAQIDVLRKMLATRIAAHLVLSSLAELGADETPVADGAICAGPLAGKFTQGQLQALMAGLTRRQLIERDQHFTTLLAKGKATAPRLEAEIEALRARLAGR